MEANDVVRVSKFLSKHPRHQPQRIGLTLEPGGWVQVDLLLMALPRHGFTLTRAELEEVVARNDKQRFAFDETGERIRASQGHSVKVDLGLEPAAPPPELFHGTGARAVDTIRTEGLRPMKRHHVHLSTDLETATRVGGRHGRPHVFRIDPARMTDAVFYVTANGVWLIDAVPPEYLEDVE